MSHDPTHPDFWENYGHPTFVVVSESPRQMAVDVASVRQDDGTVLRYPLRPQIVRLLGRAPTPTS